MIPYLDKLLPYVDLFVDYPEASANADVLTAYLGWVLQAGVTPFFRATERSLPNKATSRVFGQTPTSMVELDPSCGEALKHGRRMILTD